MFSGRRSKLLIGLAIVLALAVVPVAASDPPSISSGVIGSGIDTTLPVAAPNGLLIRTVAIGCAYTSCSPAGSTCPLPGGVSWWYDQNKLSAGESFQFGAEGTGDPLFGENSQYQLALPPAPPFSFSGLNPDGQKCGANKNNKNFFRPLGVAFVVPADNTYSVSFGLQSGAYSYQFDSGNWVAVRSPVTVSVALAAGVHVIRVSEGDNGAAAWSISGDDQPPQIAEPSASRTIIHPGTSTSVGFRTTEGGTLDVDVLRGGSVVRPLVSAKKVGVGRQSIVWDSRLGSGTLASVGKYSIRVTESDWKGRKVSQEFPLEVNDGRPTASEAKSIRAGVRRDWCAGIKRVLGAKSGKCSDWILKIKNIHVSILDRRFAIADNKLPRKKGQRAYQGGTVTLKRNGGRWLVTMAFSSLRGQSCARISRRSSVPIASLRDLKLCRQPS